MSSAALVFETISSRRGECAIASSALRNRLTSTCWIWTRSASTRSYSGSRLKPQLDALFAGAGQTERAGFLDQLATGFRRASRISPRETKSRSRRMIWPARSACSAARSSAALDFGVLGSALPASSRREPFM